MNKRRIFLALAVLAAIAVAAVAGWRLYRSREAAPVTSVVDSTQAGVRAMTLWFADDSGDSLVAETREMLEAEDLHGRVSALVAALGQGPARRGVARRAAGGGRRAAEATGAAAPAQLEGLLRTKSTADDEGPGSGSRRYRWCFIAACCASAIMTSCWLGSAQRARPSGGSRSSGSK
jgi:hypothetical protein